MQALGRHLLVDLYGCNRERLDDPDYIAAELQAAAQAAGTRVLGTADVRQCKRQSASTNCRANDPSRVNAYTTTLTPKL